MGRETRIRRAGLLAGLAVPSLAIALGACAPSPSPSLANGNAAMDADGDESPYVLCNATDDACGDNVHIVVDNRQ